MSADVRELVAQLAQNLSEAFKQQAETYDRLDANLERLETLLVRLAARYDEQEVAR